MILGEDDGHNKYHLSNVKLVARLPCNIFINQTGQLRSLMTQANRSLQSLTVVTPNGDSGDTIAGNYFQGCEVFYFITKAALLLLENHEPRHKLIVVARLLIYCRSANEFGIFLSGQTINKSASNFWHRGCVRKRRSRGNERF